MSQTEIDVLCKLHINFQEREQEIKNDEGGLRKQRMKEDRRMDMKKRSISDQSSRVRKERMIGWEGSEERKIGHESRQREKLEMRGRRSKLEGFIHHWGKKKKSPFYMTNTMARSLTC